jgi:hypothetical protein
VREENKKGKQERKTKAAEQSTAALQRKNIGLNDLLGV